MFVFGKKSKSYGPTINVYLVIKHLTDTDGVICNNRILQLSMKDSWTQLAFLDLEIMFNHSNLKCQTVCPSVGKS